MAVDCVPQTAGYLSVTTSSLEDYLFRGDHPILKDMSWSTYGMWVYRVELPPGAGTSVRAAFPRFMDFYLLLPKRAMDSHETKDIPLASELKLLTSGRYEQGSYTYKFGFSFTS